MIPNEVKIRPALIDDVPLVLDFIKRKAEFDGSPGAVEATEEAFRRTHFGDPPLAHVILAEHEGRVAGCASYCFTFSTFLARPGLRLDDLYVEADLRSRGIGKAMLAYLARLARSRGCGRIEWTAAVMNERGLAFYRRIGATVRDRTRLCRLDASGIDGLAAEFHESVPTLQ